jgi:hypothetical protein
MISNDQITLTVDPDVAAAYRAATDEEREKLALIINLQLRNVTLRRSSLERTADEISRKAQERGLTPEILEEILISC